MAAHTCCDVVVAGAAPARRRGRPSWKARKLTKAGAAGSSKPGAKQPATWSRKNVAMRRKMQALRRLVPAPTCPGGDTGAAGERGQRLDELLLHAAGYILRLQTQVRVMQAMVDALDNPED